jgi:hypothetical protein
MTDDSMIGLVPVRQLALIRWYVAALAVQVYDGISFMLAYLWTRYIHLASFGTALPRSWPNVLVILKIDSICLLQ